MSRRGLEARCPFWIDRHDQSGVIVCEGVTNRCRMQLVFRRNEDASQYKKQFCASREYAKCLVCQTVMRKYE